MLANWVSDFDIRRGDGGAAEGFSEALRAVEFDILAQLPADRPVVVTGHSLGAALAALLALRLREISRDVAAVYTFGMPRPGREDFAAAYQASGLAERTFRLVHGDDIVPTVAPSFLGFRHVGWYVPADTGKKFSRPAGEVGSDEPQFGEGISQELSKLFHHPFHQIRDYADQFRNVVGVLTGNSAAWNPHRHSRAGAGPASASRPPSLAGPIYCRLHPLNAASKGEDECPMSVAAIAP